MSEGKMVKINQGECLNSISLRHGLFWETVWNHPSNSELKSIRKDHNILYPGDNLYVPNIILSEESCPVEQLHRFRKKGVPVMFRLCLKENDLPIDNTEYTLTIDHKTYEGTTDAEGKIELAISPYAKEGRLFIGPERRECILAFGELDPINTVEGVQNRLQNLGHECGKIDGEPGPKVEAALRNFQQKHEITVTGKIDDETRKKLNEMHGN